MSQAFNFRDVIEQSTSDVALSELARKGFQKVKVLHKDAVDDLVREAVNSVVETRLKEASKKDREEIQKEARTEFDRLAREHQERESVAEGYRARVVELETQLSELEQPLRERDEELANLRKDFEAREEELEAARNLLQERDEELEELRAAPSSDSGDMQELKQSIEALASQISRGGFSAGGGGDSVADPTAAIESLFTKIGDLGIESNLDRVKTKKTKARGVANSLNKLKSMQSGDE